MTLLGPAQIRELADSLGLRPSKRLGQNFVIDPNTVQRIVRLAGVGPQDTVLEVGPGLGSLTLALLMTGCTVRAVEVDPVLAGQLPDTVARYAPEALDRLQVVQEDAVHLQPSGAPATKLVSNLPYNVGVPILLTVLERFRSVESGLVMVQWEVAERLTAVPGTRAYGVPTVKAQWWTQRRMAGKVGADVFWPAPNVQSGLVGFRRVQPPPEALRPEAFAAIDAAFAQRRKTLRSALSHWAGSPGEAERLLLAASIPPTARGERLQAADFARLASAKLDA